MNLREVLEKAVNLVGGQRPLAREMGWSVQALNQALKGVRPIPPLRAAQAARLIGLDEIEATIQAELDQSQPGDREMWERMIKTRRQKKRKEEDAA